MDDDRIWEFEAGLWTGSADHYRESIDEASVMVLPLPPFTFSGSDAIEAVAATPRWTKADFSDRRVVRPQEGLIVIAYHVVATLDDERYEANCTSTYRRRGHEDWLVVQHQQTPPPPKIAL